MIKIRSIKSMTFWFTALFSINILTGCGGSGNTTTTAPNDANLQKGWYVKLTVEDGTLKDNSTVLGYLGYLEGASDSKDRYDSEAFSSSGLYTTIYHEDFGSTKNYRSDYRTYKEAGEKSDTWIIKVNSGDANADVTLSWNGITYVTKSLKGGFDEELQTESPELTQMRLVDVETADVVPATDDGMKITFNMNGSNERTFQWILLAEGDSEPDVEPTVKIASPSARSMKVLEEESDFGFSPPSFEKR